MRGKWLVGVAAMAMMGGLFPAAVMAQEQAASVAETGETAPEVVIVTGRAQRLYRTNTTSVGKLQGEVLTQPLSVQVINARLIEDQGARDAQDLYRNLSGVSFFSYGGVTARGFRQEEVFYDGLRGDPNAGFSVPQLSNIERVEFLKGPAGMLYGPGAPGGLFNYVTRKPTEEFRAQMTAIVGDRSRLGGSGGISGRVAGPFSGRLGLFHEGRDTPRFNATSTTTIGDAGLRLDAGFGAFTAQYTRYDQNLGANRLRGVPTDNAGNFLADREWNHNEPTDFLATQASAYQLLFESSWDSPVTLSAGVRHGENRERQQYHEPNGLFDTNSDGVLDATRRQYRDQIRDLTYTSLGVNLVWTTGTEAMPVRLLAGADHFVSEAVFDGRTVNGTNVAGAGRPGPLSLRNPVYGLSNPASYTLPAFARTLSETSRTGGYVLGEVTLGRFIATAGTRFDSFEDVSGTTIFADERATGRAGLVYRATPELSFYGQWAQSFEPQSVSAQDPRAGGPFQPTEGEMVEGGAKAMLAGGRHQVTFATYQIVRRNLLQADPRGDVGGDGISDQIAFGEVTSRGFEIDVATDITPDWVLTASYAHNDTRITATNGRTVLTNSVGSRFANAPLHKLGFWTRYQIRPLGLAIALGADHVGERRSLSDQTVKPYTVFDASLIWTHQDWQVLLRVDNLTDETYAASGFIDRTGHFPGEPRSFFVELKRTW